MVADVQAVAAAHPDIVRLFSIGKTYQGRDIWVAKISDDVATDEAEPEVLFDGRHHAREHVTIEQTLDAAPLPLGGYGSDSAVTDAVDTREIYIIFNLNPDGVAVRPRRGSLSGLAQESPADARLVEGRHRPQPQLRLPLGLLRWLVGQSGQPDVSRLEALLGARDARVARLRQQPRGRRLAADPDAHHLPHQRRADPLALRPHQEERARRDMSSNDHAAFVAMGKKMASLNGYTAKQSSDLYITDGDEIDWLYGRHRIFTYTFELYPTEHYRISDFYPPDEILARETARNRSAILYLIEQADCPWRAAGLAAANCGAFYDDLELYHGWTGQRAGHRHRHRRHLAARQPSRHAASTGPSSWAPPRAPRGPWSPASRRAPAPVPTTSTAA